MLLRSSTLLLTLLLSQSVDASPLGNTYTVQVKGTDTTVYALDNSTARGDISLAAYFYLSTDGTFYFQDARSSRVRKGGVVVENGGEGCAPDKGNKSVTRCYSAKISGDTISITADWNRDWYGEGSIEQWAFSVTVSGGKCSVSSVKYTFVYKPMAGREDEGFWSKNPKFSARQCALEAGAF
jgi:hypothetical protein